MMRIVRRCFFVLVVIMMASACQNGGDGGLSSQTANDSQGISQVFMDALMAGDYETAKAMAPSEHADLVSERVDQFETLADKYEMQEVKITSTRAWIDGTGNEESDKRIEITFQYREKGTEDRWRIGSVSLRAMLDEATGWGIANLQFVRPTS